MNIFADTGAVEPMREKLAQFIKDHELTLNQVFNCDKSGLFWRLLPNKTLAGRCEKTAKSFKKPNDRVTILASANATGTFRLPLLLIGKSKCPRALKNVNLSALPLIYKSQKKAWMDSAIFKSWFFEHFVPSVASYLRDNGLSRKAVLIMDNAPSHPQSDCLQSPDGAFTCLFLPPNTTSILQPMDQGVLENLKRRYKSALLQKLLISLESNISAEQFVKSINIKDCIYTCAKAWEDIRSESLSRAWNKLLICSAQESNSPGPSTDSNDDAEALASNDPGAVASNDPDDVGGAMSAHGTELNLSPDEVHEWLDADYNLAEEFTDEEIAHLCDPESNIVAESSDSESEPESSACDLVSHKEAVAAFDTAIRYLEQQPDTSSIHVMLLNKLRSFAMTEYSKKLKQRKITQYMTSRSQN